MTSVFRQDTCLGQGRKAAGWLNAIPGAWRLLIVCISLAMPMQLQAAPVANLYAAEVDMPAGGRDLDQAFKSALARVLVKVSGLPELGSQQGLAENARRFVSKYSRRPDNKILVEFDPNAVSRILDAAGHPVWGANRPLVAVWLVVDRGNGRREIVSSTDGGGNRSTDSMGSMRDVLARAADMRGLPIVFPLQDAEELKSVTASDVWGNFREPVFTASQRYRADAILIGRASSTRPGRGVRWLLDTGAQQHSWQGSVADGPLFAAEYMARSLATFANAADTLRLVIGNVNTLADYGQLRNYLRSLNLIEKSMVSRIDGNHVEFDLVVRGDAQRLKLALDSSRALSRDPAVSGLAGNLQYVWSGSR